MTHTISIAVQAVKNVEFHEFQRGTTELEFTPAQLSDAFEALYESAPEATREVMQQFIAEQVSASMPPPHPEDVEGNLKYLGVHA